MEICRPHGTRQWSRRQRGVKQSLENNIISVSVRGQKDGINMAFVDTEI